MKKIKIFSLFVMLSLIISGCNSKKILGENQEITYENLKFNLPESFAKEEDEGGVYYTWDDVEGEKKNSCYLSINSYELFSSDNIEKIAYEYASIYTDNVSDIKVSTENINGTSWAKAELYINEKSSVYSYVAVNNGKVYEIHYDDYGSGNICAQAITKVETSLKFKK